MIKFKNIFGSNLWPWAEGELPKRILNKLIFVFLILLSIVLTLVFTRNIDNKHFLFIHDEFLTLGSLESRNVFHTYNPSDLGITNTTVMFVSLFERIYYFFTSLTQLTLRDIQVLFYLLKLLLVVIVPYVSFSRLSKVYQVKGPISILSVSLWYSFNTYTLIYWHGNGFSLTLLLCYVLAPLALYLYHQAVFGTRLLIDKLKFVTCLFLMSFALYLAAVFGIYLILYTIFYTLFSKQRITLVVKQIGITILLFLPFLPLLFLIPYDLLFNASKTVNQIGNETFSSLQGNLLYPFFMWFSWGIYTHWEPRNIYTFDKYFYTFGSIIAPFIIYGLIIWRIIKKGAEKYTATFLIIFLALFLFVKGAQEPFGFIYKYLINYVAVFRIFRSPDNKFGFGIVLALAQLLLIVVPFYRKKWFVFFLGTVILIQGLLIFNGTAVIGQDTKSSSTRVISIPSEQVELIKVINEREVGYGYIMPFPNQTFAIFLLEEGKRHIGQDLLPKFTKFPFLNVSADGGISRDTYQLLVSDLKLGDLEGLKKFPIRYLLLRKDIEGTSIEASLAAKIDLNYERLLNNKMFELYSFPGAVPLIESPNVEFKIINSTKYQVTLRNLNQNQKFYFNQSYNSNWKLYPASLDNTCYTVQEFVLGIRECKKNLSLSGLADIKYLWQKPLFDSTHTQNKGYANGWVINIDELKHRLNKDQYQTNVDGSIDVTITLYYRVQSIFNSGAFIAVSYFLLCLVSLIYYTRRKHV